MAWTAPSTWVAGAILTAAQLNTQLRDNMLCGGPIYATEALRDAAITSPFEGQRAYITGSTVAAATATTYQAVPTGITTIYNGSVWVCVTEVGAYTTNTGTSTSATYTATLLGSPGTNPSVTLSTGTSALITMASASANNGGAGQASAMSVAVSGATTLAASDNNWVIHSVATTTTEITGATSFILTGLSAGTNTFTLNYRVSANTGSWNKRSLIVKGIA